MQNNIDFNFDCNTIISSYNDIILVKNIYNSFYKTTYSDIYTRIQNKKFCYIAEDLTDFYKYIQHPDKYELITLKYYIINNFLYAIKLISFGWIMDEFFLKNRSWTINYWKNYKRYLNIIKLNKNYDNNHGNYISSSMVIYNINCKLCKKKLNLNDIVFNMKHIYVYYECLFYIIYKKN